MTSLLHGRVWFQRPTQATPAPVTARVLARLRSPEPASDPLADLSAQERRILDVSIVLAKLGMHRRSEAAAYAARLAERRRTRR
jgi:hypothetical protein